MLWRNFNINYFLNNLITTNISSFPGLTLILVFWVNIGMCQTHMTSLDSPSKHNNLMIEVMMRLNLTWWITVKGLCRYRTVRSGSMHLVRNHCISRGLRSSQPHFLVCASKLYIYIYIYNFQTLIKSFFYRFAHSFNSYFFLTINVFIFKSFNCTVSEKIKGIYLKWPCISLYSCKAFYLIVLEKTNMKKSHKSTKCVLALGPIFQHS